MHNECGLKYCERNAVPGIAITCNMSSLLQTIALQATHQHLNLHPNTEEFTCESAINVESVVFFFGQAVEDIGTFQPSIAMVAIQRQSGGQPLVPIDRSVGTVRSLRCRRSRTG